LSSKPDVVNPALAAANARRVLNAFIQRPFSVFPQEAYDIASASEFEETKQLAQHALELCDTLSAKHGSD